MLITDAHVYVGESIFGQDQSLGELINRMDYLEIDKAVLYPNRPKDYALGPANQMLAGFINEHPNRFYGLARVDPWQRADALRDLKHAIEKLGLHGLLLHPWEENFQIAKRLVDPLLEYAAEYNIPVFVEAGYSLVSHPLDVAELAHRHNEVIIIGTHGLQLDSSAFALVDAEKAMRECKNLIMETSGMYAPEVMERIVNDLGKDRLIFGSHSPWYNQALELKRAELLDLNAEQKEAVIGGNIVGIFEGSRNT